MVSHPGAPLGARDLRRLNAPTPIRVQVDGKGCPRGVWRRGHPASCAVVRVRDRWRIDDEWWRDRPISRRYYAVLLEDGTLLTVYRDLCAADAWFEQRDRA